MAAPPTPSRRQLLASGLTAGAVLATPSCTVVEPNEPVELTPPAHPFDISLAQWSLHRTHGRGDLDPLDFPRHAREAFGIGAVEYVSTFYPGKATDFAYLRQLRDRCDAVGVRSLLIMIDGEGALADTDESERRRSIGRHFKWIAAARFLGCHAIRVNLSGGGTWAKQRNRAADSLLRLGDVGAEYDIDVIVENHGGLSSNGKWLTEVMQEADHPRVGTLPDFGNFNLRDGASYDRYLGIEELMPFARAVSAKSNVFDDVGDEVNIDYRRMLRIVLDAGYRGFIGIEYEGNNAPEAEGIRLTKALLERVRGELAAEYE